jgi:8-oxo-dGTP diphosphatase
LSNSSTLVVAAIIHRGDTLLICQRPSTGTYPCLWEFPGGKVEFGESPENALIRECKEELAISIRVDSIYDVASILTENRHIVLLFYLCTLLAGEPQTLECQDFRWITPQDLDQFEFPPADENLLKKMKGSG